MFTTQRTILSKIEQGNPDYQEMLSKAIKDAFSNSGNRKTMTVEEACEKIRKISKRVIGKV